MAFYHFQTSHWNLSDLRGHTLSISVVLLTFFSFLFIAFLFFRLVCYRERRFPDAMATNLTMNSHHTIAIPAQPLGLDANTIKNLPMFVHRSNVCSGDDGTSINSNFKESDCSICLGLYEDEEMVKVMPDCLHTFHSDCVDKWLRNRSTCPLCRLALDSSAASAVA
ncbi:hypothetical protein ACH5RR_020628 [Cinchona calisaya]|uniref:RING-type domain-containing protein n=1 Tax=Cinchona calisaya TaxID=153742 RepID=A0ABD2ZEZ8_9GENT